MGSPLRALFALLACLAAAGCASRDPLAERVTADSPVGLQMWLSRAPGRLSAEQMADFREAIQELRFAIMATGAASGSEPVEAALCVSIDGRTVRQVLLDGFGRQAGRLGVERRLLEASARANARLRVRPGDAASLEYLDRERERVERRLGEAAEGEARARRILAAYSGQFD
jgi:hypothetical protein